MMITRYILKSDDSLPWNNLVEKLKLWRTVDEETSKENFIKITETQDKYVIAILRYYIRMKEVEVTLDDNGEEKRKENDVIKQNWARLYFLRPQSPQFVLIRFQPETSRYGHVKNKVRVLISRCIAGTDDYFQYARFNIEAIHNDYSVDTWVGAIKDRSNNVRSGVLFGTNIAGDSDFGAGYVRSPKNYIGVYTNYFGGREPIRYNKHSFQLYKDHEDDEIIA